MKSFIAALAAVIMLAGLVISPAAAASSSAGLEFQTCDDTYTVQHRDNLSKIAKYCGVTVADILWLNPQIKDPNLIRTGQVLNLSASAVNTESYSSEGASVSVSDTRVEYGDEITVKISGFPANSYVDYLVGEEGEDYTDVYDGTVDENGEDSITIEVPFEADDGEYWVIVVATTSQKEGVEVTSSRIYIDE